MSAADPGGAPVRPALLGQLKELRLPTVRQCYEETARQAERETLSYERYLLEVITRECEQRRKTRVERLLRESELPLEKSLPNFDVKRLPAKAQRQLRTLLEGDFLDRKENILVFGRPGSGKSHLLTALAQELIVMRERRMHFTKCSLLMQDLLAAKRDLRLSREIKRLGRFEGLIIDDLGYLQQSRDDMEVVFTLLQLRSRSAPRQFVQVRQAGRVGARLSRRGHYPIVAGDLTFDFEAASDPIKRRVEKEHGLRDRLQQLRPIIRAAKMRQFVTEHLLEFFRTQLLDQPIWKENGAAKVAGRHRDPNVRRGQQPDVIALAERYSPALQRNDMAQAPGDPREQNRGYGEPA